MISRPLPSFKYWGVCCKGPEKVEIVVRAWSKGINDCAYGKSIGLGKEPYPHDSRRLEEDLYIQISPYAVKLPFTSLQYQFRIECFWFYHERHLMSTDSDTKIPPVTWYGQRDFYFCYFVKKEHQSAAQLSGDEWSSVEMSPGTTLLNWVYRV